jgi:hypothetical protein
MHGCGPVAGVENAQPAIRYWSDIVVTGWPPTVTRGLLGMAVT